MYLADCHVHSNVSADAEGSMTELAQLVLRAEQNEVCFAGHGEAECILGSGSI